MESTKEMLLAMMKTYNIGKKPLARLLGWGETTILRYLDGVEPNAEFMRRIRELKENPWEYDRLLSERGSCLTPVAYRKTKEAVAKQLFCDRSAEAVQYVIRLAKGDIAPYRVMAVLYYAQVASLVLEDSPLFEEPAVFSTEAKSVYPKLYEDLLKQGIRSKQPEMASFSEKEEEYLRGVWQLLNGFSPNAVRMLLHLDKKRIRKNLRNAADCISHEVLKRQYEIAFHKTEVTEVEQLVNYFRSVLVKPTR